MAAPSLGYLREYHDYTTQRFSAQKTVIREARALRQMKHLIDVPPQYAKTTKQFHSPLLADAVQRISATLSVNEPGWIAVPTGDGESHQKVATLKEKWMKAVLMRMERLAKRRIFRHLISSATGDGMAAMQFTYDPLTWAPWPRRQKEEEPDQYTKRTNQHVMSRTLPIGWRDIDPLSYYFDDGEVMLVEERPVKPTLRRLGVLKDDDALGEPVPEGEARGTGETKPVWEHWNDEYVSWAVDEKIVKQMKHPFKGRLPFFHFAGLSSHERAPEQEFKPVCWAYQELVPLLDRLLTMKSNWAYLHSFPRAVLHLTYARLSNMAAALGATPDGTPPRAPEIDLNSVITLYDNESFELVSPAPVGQDLNDLIQIVLSMIQSVGLGDILKGNITGGDPSGYGINQLIQAAKLAYDPIIDNAQFAFGAAAEFLLWMVEKVIRRDVYVWGENPSGKGQTWLHLGPDDIKGFYVIQPRLEPLLPSNALMEARAGLEQMGQGAISKHTHRDKYLHMEAPEEEEHRILLEQAKEMVKEQLILRAGIKAGILPPEMGQPQAPPPPPSGLVDQYGAPISLGNQGLPVQPGQGMPMTPPAPPGSVPGVLAPGQPGGQFGQGAEGMVPVG